MSKAVAATKSGENKAQAELQRDRQSFERRRKQLLRRYPGQFVAVSHGQVVGHDRDDEALAARMFAKFGDGSFYIGHLEEGRSVYELPSPEVTD